MPSSKELMSAPPAVTAGGTIEYLGVPKGFQAQRDDEGQKTLRPPMYEEGAQYKPNGYSRELQAQMQLDMDAAGLYDKGDNIRLGVWDDTTVAAYTKLLKYANQGGRDVTEAFNELGTLSAAERVERGLGGIGSPGSKGAAKSPLVVSLSNPNDLRTLVDRTARKTLGRAVSEKEMSKFVNAYQAMERQEQTQADAVGETGGTVVQAPDPSVFAEQQVEAMDPVAAEGNRQLEYMKIIAQEFGGMRG